MREERGGGGEKAFSYIEISKRKGYWKDVVVFVLCCVVFWGG